MHARLIALVLLFTVCTSWAAQPADLSTAPAGKRIQDYLTAFNSHNDSTMRAFLAANFTDSALAQRGLDDRIAVYHRVQSDIPHMEFQRLVHADPGSTVIVVQAGENPLELTFDHQSVPPHKLIGLRIDRRVSPSAEANLPPMSEASVLDSIGAILTQRASADSFSGAVLIARNGQPLLRKAYGLADREHNAPNTPDTKFNLGSIGKSFTRIAVEHLIVEGKISPSDRLGKFLKDYPNTAAMEKVTVQMLLDMRSGIGDFFGDEYLNTPRDRIRNLHDYLPLFAAKPLLFEPGTLERYSNGGFVVLGLIIESVTGKSYFEYVKDVVFDPAGMNNSGWFASDAILTNRAIGYTHRWQPVDEDSPELRSNVLTEPGIGSSAGGGYSTVDDLLKFVNAIESGKLQSSEGRGGMGIAGGAPGINAAIESGIPGGFTVIVVCNADPPLAENTASMLRGWLRRVKS